MCAVHDTYEQDQPLDLFNSELLERLASHVSETKNLYQVFAQVQWQETAHEKVVKAFAVVSERPLTFEWFCRCLPFFKYLGTMVLTQSKPSC